MLDKANKEKMRGVDFNVPRIRIYFKVNTDIWKRNVKEVLNIVAETDVVFMGSEW